MKLFHKYSRINLSFMMMIFILSGVLYFVLVRFVLIHELDEALTDYKDRIEAYSNEHHQLPQRCMLDQTLIDYYPASKNEKDHSYFMNRFDPSEKRTHKYRQLEFTQQAGNQYYRITIARELEGTNMLLKTIVYTTLGLILVIIIVSVLINMLLLKRLWRPFYSTIHQLKTFKLGNKEDVHFEETNIDEFALLNQNVNATIERARNEYKTLKEFTENAAHEMQTPVSIIRSKLDLMIQQEGLSDKQTDAIKSAYQGIQRLNKLNQALLLLAKIENQQFSDRQAIDLDKKIAEKVSQFQGIWDNMHLNIKKELFPTKVIANDSLMEVLLNNIFSNAARHNYDGGAIHIHLNNGKLTISNTGPSKALAEKTMFERFNKGDQSSHQNGLGLSIVKEICEQSGIEIAYRFEDNFHHFHFNFKS